MSVLFVCNRLKQKRQLNTSRAMRATQAYIVKLTTTHSLRVHSTSTSCAGVQTPAGNTAEDSGRSRHHHDLHRSALEASTVARALLNIRTHNQQVGMMAGKLERLRRRRRCRARVRTEALRTPHGTDHSKHASMRGEWAQNEQSKLMAGRAAPRDPPHGRIQRVAQVARGPSGCALGPRATSQRCKSSRRFRVRRAPTKPRAVQPELPAIRR